MTDLNFGASVGSREKAARSKGTLRIEAVVNDFGEGNIYTPGGSFKVLGRGFGDLSEVPADIGVYLSPASHGRLVRVFRYQRWSDSEIEGVWPAGISGPQRLFVEIRARDGRTRSAVLSALLQNRSDTSGESAKAPPDQR